MEKNESEMKRNGVIYSIDFCRVGEGHKSVTRRKKKRTKQTEKRGKKGQTTIYEAARVCRDEFEAIQEFDPTVHKVSPLLGK